MRQPILLLVNLPVVFIEQPDPVVFVFEHYGAQDPLLIDIFNYCSDFHWVLTDDIALISRDKYILSTSII